MPWGIRSPLACAHSVLRAVKFLCACVCCCTGDNRWVTLCAAGGCGRARLGSTTAWSSLAPTGRMKRRKWQCTRRSQVRAHPCLALLSRSQLGGGGHAVGEQLQWCLRTSCAVGIHAVSSQKPPNHFCPKPFAEITWYRPPRWRAPYPTIGHHAPYTCLARPLPLPSALYGTTPRHSLHPSLPRPPPTCAGSQQPRAGTSPTRAR